MKDEPPFWQRWIDAAVTGSRGGLRVRVLDAVDEAGVRLAVGVGAAQINRFDVGALAKLVRELKPTQAGVIDVRKRADGTLDVRVQGPLAEEGFEQRLRNVLTNR